MIKPTIARNLHYFLAGKHDDPLACLLVGVNSDTNINLAVFNHDGSHFRAENVLLVQSGETPPNDAPYAAWMEYQLGQAAKTEAAQAAAAAAPGADPAPAIDLGPLHTKLSELEQGVEGKFHDLGNWLQKTVGDFHSRLTALEKPPAAPGADEKPPAEQQPQGQQQQSS